MYAALHGAGLDASSAHVILADETVVLYLQVRADPGSSLASDSMLRGIMGVKLSLGSVLEVRSLMQGQTGGTGGPS